jgi:hypothetical protein
LSCQMNFCKRMNFQLMQFSIFFPKPCMFLLLLCLGTILAPTSPASCQPSCSPPPSSGSVGAASFHPLNHSTMAPTQFCAAVPASSPYESGHGTRWSPSAALKPAWLRMPCRGRPLGSRPGGPAATKRFFTFFLFGATTNDPRAVFLPSKEGFCTAGTSGACTASTDVVPVPSTGTTQEVRPLTSSPPSRS